MAAANRGRAEHCSSPERTKVWTETTRKKKVSVVYYLSRNGQLEQPHFMEVTLSSRDGLYLRDVINRLNFLRGNGMGSLYSWSSKRSYKNGFVWHDLSEDDFIYPAHGQEYVLKGSELLRSSSSPASHETTDSERADFPPERRKKMPSRSTSIDFAEYKVYKDKLMSADASVKALDAATQTDDEWRRRRRRVFGEGEDVGENGGEVMVEEGNPTTELCCDEISPPPSSSSTETLESLIKSDGRITVTSAVGVGDENLRSAAGCTSGRFRASASAVLMNLISCGSISVKDHGGVTGGGYFPPPRGRPAEHSETTQWNRRKLHSRSRELLMKGVVETSNGAIRHSKREIQTKIHR
ncbi:uncharacterized protein LOC110026674 [Phalaenopsis equestris]|uniref:uncharacterized protein LOC110026674 n=1 Tax=Phalaenopsis equestris TaxID=78828 RepID=UPI0009E60906|nr:uncharacterized protein LOC110026674 [Phalaenopsis equestris]